MKMAIPNLARNGSKIIWNIKWKKLTSKKDEHKDEGVESISGNKTRKKSFDFLNNLFMSYLLSGTQESLIYIL